MMLKHNKGFTIVELMVGVALMAIVTSVIVGTQVNIAHESTLIVHDLDDSIDQKMAERILFKDFNAVDISYNNLSFTDDNGNQFFDYYPDVPVNALKKTPERIITLQNGGKLEFWALSQNLTAGPLLIYDPLWSYDVGPTPDDPNVAATLTFNPTKGMKFVGNVEQGGRKEFWKTGHVLMFDTPSRIRPIVNNTIDMQTAPRSPIFLGTVTSDANAALAPIIAPASGYLKMTQPLDGSPIPSLDSFLRKVPAIGGGQSIVRVRVANIVKYWLERDTAKVASDYDAVPMKLYKATYNQGKFDNPLMLADGVASLMIRRDSVIKRMIYFKITKVNKKKPI